MVRVATVQHIEGSLSISVDTSADIESLDFSDLHTIDGDLSFEARDINSDIVGIRFPKLKRVGGSITIGGSAHMGALNALEFSLFADTGFVCMGRLGTEDSDSHPPLLLSLPPPPSRLKVSGTINIGATAGTINTVRFWNVQETKDIKVVLAALLCASLLLPCAPPRPLSTRGSSVCQVVSEVSLGYIKFNELDITPMRITDNVLVHTKASADLQV